MMSGSVMNELNHQALLRGVRK